MKMVLFVIFNAILVLILKIRVFCVLMIIEKILLIVLVKMDFFNFKKKRNVKNVLDVVLLVKKNILIVPLVLCQDLYHHYVRNVHLDFMIPKMTLF